MPTEVSTDDVMSEINMTPFVDVILVLLIIFLVTLPLVQQTVNIDLPKVDTQRLADIHKPIRISIDREGLYLLDQMNIEIDVLQLKLMTESQRDPKPVVLLYADKNARYENIAKVLAIVHQSGMGKVGFVTQDEDKD